VARSSTSAEIAARQGLGVGLIEQVLRSEARRGNVTCVGDEWQVTPELVREYGAAFGYLTVDVDAPARKVLIGLLYDAARVTREG
jgi:hypothetical protein